TPSDARSLFPAAFISHACHALRDVVASGSDAAVLSPICVPRKGRDALGLAALTQARALLDEDRSTKALYALGGVESSTAAGCLEHGATGVAVIGAVPDGRDPSPLIRALAIER